MKPVTRWEETHLSITNAIRGFQIAKAQPHLNSNILYEYLVFVLGLPNCVYLVRFENILLEGWVNKRTGMKDNTSRCSNNKQMEIHFNFRTKIAVFAPGKTVRRHKNSTSF